MKFASKDVKGIICICAICSRDRGKYEHDRGMADTMVNQMELLIHSYRHYQKVNEEEKKNVKNDEQSFREL